MPKIGLFLLMPALLIAASVPTARADDWRWHGDIHRFHEHDYHHWRQGRWFHGFHDGSEAWWWVVGGFWYFYPVPIYPYPDPYTPPVVVIEPAPVSPAFAPPAYVYYCSAPAGYYPYVPQCYGVWQKIPANAAVAPPVAPPPAYSSPPQPAPMPPAPTPSGSQRNIDDRQLNAFAVEFQNIDLKEQHAHAILENLEARVEAFRQSLFQRNYNAMDILKDAEDLEHRIAEQRQKFPAYKE
jgi:hypothetical protein